MLVMVKRDTFPLFLPYIKSVAAGSGEKRLNEKRDERSLTLSKKQRNKITLTQDWNKGKETSQQTRSDTSTELVVK